MEVRYSLFEKILGNRLVTHIIFWSFMLFIQLQIFYYTSQSFSASIISLLSITPVIMLAAYTLVYYQIPKLAFKRRYLLFVLSLVLSFYLFTVLARLSTVFIAEPILGVVENTSAYDMFIRVISSVDRLMRNYLISVYFIPIIMAMIKLLKLRSDERVRLEELEKEKATTELNFLKAQIHPHFLLNTLNNIYALSLKQSDKTPESVLKLSEMLTYVLYKCNEDFVLLKDEIQLIENYIDLEQLRYGNNLKVEFEKDVADNTVRIAPLILLSLVENAFKHGVSGDIDAPLIQIALTSDTEVLTFRVFNTKSKRKQTDYTNYTKGIGSKNVKKQLDLLYSEAHNIETRENDNSYEVNLTLNIKTNNG